MTYGRSMTVVLVHGNPETASIWDPLRAELGRDDVVALSPPGFGAPVPDGFAAHSDDYLAWLIGELEAMDGPIDLVGHDWGGGHVQRLAATRPDLIRSWVTDIAGCADPEYVWHDMAQVWQTPDAGEEAVAGLASTPSADLDRRLRGPRHDARGGGIVRGRGDAVPTWVAASWPSTARPPSRR